MYPPSQPPLDTLPTMYDLPSEDPEEPGLPDLFHLLQPRLLDNTCRPSTLPANQVFTATDLNLYYDLEHPLWHKRPDWFLVLGKAPASHQQDLLLSYVMWQEKIAPFLIVELLSPGTEAEDLGKTLRAANAPPTKWQVYEQILQVPYYIIFDRYKNKLRAFHLATNGYQELSLINSKIWFDQLQLGLGIWQGDYEGTTGLWLRWYCEAERWLPAPTEELQEERQRAEQEKRRAEQEKQRAEQEKQRAEQEKQRAERLAEQLRALGIEPDD